MIGEQLDWNNENDADEMQVSERGMFTESDEKRKKELHVDKDEKQEKIDRTNKRIVFF